MLITNDDFKAEFERRLKIHKKVMSDDEAKNALISHYKNAPVDFINDWGMTFNPRNSGSKDKLAQPITDHQWIAQDGYRYLASATFVRV